MRALAGFTNAIPFLMALLSVVAFVPWILAIPGSTGSSYSRGWEIGLYAIVFYPVVYALIGSLEQLAKRGWLGRSAGVFRALVWMALAAFVAAQATAWSMMLSR